MTRTVQIELTLNVEVDCFFSERIGGWIVKRIDNIEAVHNRDRCQIGPTYNLHEYLMHNREEELADLFAQQEP